MPTFGGTYVKKNQVFSIEHTINDTVYCTLCHALHQKTSETGKLIDVYNLGKTGGTSFTIAITI